MAFVFPAMKGQSIIEYAVNKAEEQSKIENDDQSGKFKEQYEKLKDEGYADKEMSVLFFFILTFIFAIGAIFWPLSLILKITKFLDKKSGGIT